ncbi:MAG: rane protein [Sphingomonas bacterium]|nr:rane protein [Sphingomonas bacterium]
MTHITAPLMSAIDTILAVMFYLFTAARTGKARVAFGIAAPATVGHPIFERAYRVQMNTLEQLAAFVPLLWLTAFYPMPVTWIASLVGLVWLVGRVLYLRAYMHDPKTRAMGAMTSGLAIVALLALAIAGVLRAGLGWA